MQTEALFSDIASHVIDELAEYSKNENLNQGLFTGFFGIEYIGRFHPGDLIILGGRPSMGKTTLGLNIAMNVSKDMLTNQNYGSAVAFFSLEMSKEQLIQKALSAESGVARDRIRKGPLSLNDFTLLTKSREDCRNLPLIVNDSPEMNISSLRREVSYLKRKKNIGFIVVDCLQLLESNKGFSNPVQEVSAITRGLKNIAKEFNIAVLALSRLPSQRKDQYWKPHLSDLRGLGSIEQDADLVMFLHREAYYEDLKQPLEGTEKHLEWQERMGAIYNKADLIVVKNRHGAVRRGRVVLDFDHSLNLFKDWMHVYGGEF